jgi:hypothetical protein
LLRAFLPPKSTFGARLGKAAVRIESLERQADRADRRADDTVDPELGENLRAAAREYREKLPKKPKSRTDRPAGPFNKPEPPESGHSDLD